MIKKLTLCFFLLAIATKISFAETPEENEGDFDKKITNQSLEEIVSKNPNLTKLSLQDRQDITDKELSSYLNHKLLPKLIDLNLSNTKITQNGLVSVGKLNGLTRLNLQELNIKQMSLVPLKNLSKLEELNLAKNKLTDSVLYPIGAFKNLISLDLSENLVTDTTIGTLKSLNKIRDLDLSKTRITNRGITSLQPLKGLRLLNLSDNPQITDEGAKNIPKGVTQLLLNSTKVTDIGVSNLKVLRLTDLDLGKTLITNEALKSIAKIQSLEFVEVDSPKITYDGVIEHLINAKPRLDKLTYLTCPSHFSRDEVASIDKFLNENKAALKNKMATPKNQEE